MWMNLEPIIQSDVSQKKQISYINAYMWNLERWYWWTYLQGSKGGADIESKHVDTVRKEEGKTNWNNRLETYALPRIKWIASGNLLYDSGSSNQWFVKT